MGLPRTDVLIPVRLNHIDAADMDGFLQRFGHAIRSMSRMPHARLCVADVSRHSALSALEAAADGVKFEYAHRVKLGQYNRSHNINFGFKQLVRSEFFMVSDADLVYKQEALAAFTGPADPNKCSVVPRKKQVTALWSDDWVKADSVEGKLTSTNGSFFMAKDAFAKVRGFDEGFVGWGSEDDDFYSRLSFSGVAVVRPGFASDALAIHLYHPEHHTINPQQRNANRSRRDSQTRLVADKKIKPWDVNTGGWGQ